MKINHAITIPLLFIASTALAQVERVDGLPFPRLGMWWPDPENQSLDDIARYDLMMLGNEQSDRDVIAGLRLRNPDILLLTSTNACEMPSIPVAQIPDPILQSWAQLIPADWLLTQVGSQLTTPIDVTQSIFPLAQLAAGSIDLFAVGEDVLIGTEITTIQSINTKANTITVQRGSKRPATSHPVGTRVVSLIEFWPGTWVMDTSNNCPLITVDSKIGPERWTDFNARFSTFITQLDDWDGIIIDRSDPNESWLVGVGNTRTIDPDRSNTLVTNYDAFDASWNAGLRNLESKLRSALGEDKVILGNQSMDNYDLLNGTVFEAFPKDFDPSARPSYSIEWEKEVLGPSLKADIGSYFQWMNNTTSSPVSLIETYEDNGFPGDDSSSLSCTDAGFVPNYRKMRFGLTTALMNDGFFSYEMDTASHGALCLMGSMNTTTQASVKAISACPSAQRHRSRCR